MEPEPQSEGNTKHVKTSVAEWLFAQTDETPSDHGLLEKAGDFIANYRLIELLGEGGFGVVWRAEQREPIQREVALKVIKPGMDSREIVARFEAERQALARMEHPNIAGVLDAGATPGGRPYFVMELVKGLPITAYADARKLTVRQRLELFIPVCQAVQHAHQKAILHRDLKPSNILVSEVDGAPAPKVIDFGIAKALGTSAEEALRASLLRTRTGSVVGTPRYMSPEQAGAYPDMDTRSDIYTLGVILYELLTGDTPLSTESLRKAPFDEVLRMVREATAHRPSSRLAPVTEIVRQAAAERAIEPGKLTRTLRGDLDWITLKALEKERERRYESASALAADIERHLGNLPVEAGPPSVTYRMGKFARRNRLALICAAVVVVVLNFATGFSIWQAVKAERSRVQAEANFSRARDAVDQYLNRVTDNPRLKEADFHELRKQLLETAVPFYEQFVAQKSEDQKLRIDQAIALDKLRLVYRTMGDLPKADAMSRRALEIQSKVVAKTPSAPEYQRELAASYSSLGTSLKDQGQEAKAEAALRSALAIEVKLAADHPAIPLYQLDLARNHANLGNVLTHRVQWVEAEAEYRRTLEIMEKLAAENPTVMDCRLELGRTHASLGYMLTLRARWGEADTAYRRALEVLEKLMADFPTAPECQRSLELSYNDYGDFLLNRGKSAQAAEGFERALKIQEILVAKFPSVPEYRGDLARSHFNMGMVLQFQNQLAKAEEAYHHALEIQERLMADFPMAPRYLKELAISDNAIGCLQQTRGKKLEAEAAFHRALENREKLAADFPSVPEYQSDVGGSLNNLAMVPVDRQQWREARSLYERAIIYQRKALAADPKNSTYREFLRNHYWGLSHACAGMGDHAAAVATALELPKLYPGGWEEYKRAASLIVPAIPSAENDPSLTADQRLQIAESYAQQAVGLLRQAIANGYKNAATLKTQEQFATLRARQDFQALLPSEPAAH
jgi:serine/threonine protein kinase/tetratricopeptide (TPR) repeat protein